MRTVRQCVIVLVILSVLFAVSCNGAGEEFFDLAYEGSSGDPEFRTFGGEHVVTNGFDGNNGAFGYMEETEFCDLTRKRISDVEKKLDVKIDVTKDTDYSSLILSGTFFADAMMASSFGMIGSIRSGLFTSLSEILDVTDIEKYGNPTQLTSGFWKGGLYGVIPISWPEAIYNEIAHLLAINGNLVAKMGLVDPREYSDQGTWTWDNFQKYLIEATQNVGDKTVYGIGACSPYYAEMFDRTAGGNLVYMDEDGNVSIGWYRNSDAVSALLKAQEIKYGDTAYCFYPSDDVSVLMDGFMSDCEILYCVNEGGMFGGETSIMYNMDNVGIVQWPYAVSREESLCSVHESMVRMTVIPINTKDPDATGAVISALFEPLDGYETKDSIKNYLNRSLFFDERDTQLLLDMCDRCYYTFFIDGARIFEEKTMGYKATPMDISQALQELKNQYDIILEKYVSPTFEGMKTVWSAEKIRDFFYMN